MHTLYVMCFQFLTVASAMVALQLTLREKGGGRGTEIYAYALKLSNYAIP